MHVSLGFRDLSRTGENSDLLPARRRLKFKFTQTSTHKATIKQATPRTYRVLHAAFSSLGDQYGLF